MKKVLFLCCALLTLSIAHAQFPNVSTGINSSGSIPLGTQESNWALVSPSPITGQAYAVWNGSNHTLNYVPGAWEVTPVSGTHAQWIGPRQDMNGDPVGQYTFERPFPIATGTGSFACNFAVADDDIILSLALVRPNGTTIPLTVTLVTNQYHLSKTITNVINCPDTGTWKIRAVVDFQDGASDAFLLSGYINTSTKITCDTSCKFTLVAGGVTGSPFSCGSTINLNCNTVYDFAPQLSCNGNGCSTNVISVSLKDPSNNTPSWANTFIAGLGNGTLNIPGGITPGIYTLTYNYGINGKICGTCNFKLNISCAPCCTITNTVAVSNGGKKRLKCGDTLVLSCGTTNSFSPVLNCNGDANSHLINIKILDIYGNPVSWANTTAFFTNLGSGSLTIPANTSGFFTLRYIFGKNCQPCDSCSYILKIQCCGNFTVSAGPDIVKCTTTVQLNATVTGGVSPFAYVWSPTTGLNNPNIPNPTCSTTGTYIITATDAIGCVQTDTVKITSGGLGCKSFVQGMQQSELNASSNKLQAVPNPYTNSFTINGLESTAASLDILSIEGKTIMHYNNIYPQQSFGKGLSAGIYMIKILYKDGSSITLKTIKN